MKENTQKETALRLMAMNSFGSAIGLALALPTKLVKAYYLGASGLGILKAAELILQYGSFSDLGLTRTLSRQIPIAQGRKDESAVQEIRNIVFTGTLATLAPALLIGWLVYLSGVDFKGTLDLPIVVLICLLHIANRSTAYVHTYAKGVGAFDLVGREAVVTSTMTPLATLPGAILLGVKGVLIAQLLAALSILAIYRGLLTDLRLKLTLPFRKTWELLKIGFLIYINQFANTMFWTVDATLVAWFLLPSDLGLYAFAMSILTMAVSIPSALNLVYFREMLVERGQSEGDYSYLKKYLGRRFIGFLMLSAMALGLSYFGYTFIVRMFLSEFLPSVPVMQVLVLGQMLFAATYFTSLYFNVSDQLVRRAVTTGLCLIFNLAIDLLLLHLGFGLIGVAWGSTVSYALFAFVLVFTSMSQLYGEWRKPTLVFLGLAGVSVLLFGLIVVLDQTLLVGFEPLNRQWVNLAAAAADATVKLVIYQVVCAALYATVFYRYRPQETLWSAFDYFLTAGRNVLGRKARLGRAG